MILCSQIYDTLVSIIRKDKRGLSLSIDDFNSSVVQVNQRIYRLNYSNFEASKLSMDEMDSFKLVGQPIALDGTGKGLLPDDYFHLAGNPYWMHPTAGRRQIDLITSLEHGARELDYLTKASALYPTAYMGAGSSAEDMSIHVTPVTCTPIYIDYLREVDTPFLDYYVNNTTFEITYMAASVNVAVPAGCTARNGTLGPANVASLTKNFEWHEHDIPQIINIFLGLIGVQLQAQDLTQLSGAYESIIEKE
jgi:hypothetical protein